MVFQLCQMVQYFKCKPEQHCRCMQSQNITFLYQLLQLCYFKIYVVAYQGVLFYFFGEILKSKK